MNKANSLLRQDVAGPGTDAEQGNNVNRLAVSVVVPTLGRPDLLNRCLAALTSQNFQPTDYEVIVVDDGPSELTRNTVSDWTARMERHRLAVRYVPNHGPHGPAAARNRGWRAAQSAVIAFTDDDTVPTADWLRNGLEALNDDIDVISGGIEMPLPSTPTDYERDAQHLETAEFVTANCICRRQVMEAVDGFDERFRFAWREDSDLHFKLLSIGARIVRAPQALVIHPVRPASWGVSIKQQKKVLFDALLYKKHPKLYRERIRSRPHWDYYLTVGLLAAGMTGLAKGHPGVAAAAFGGWMALSARFCWMRLRNTVKTASHISEMVVTSVVIPPVALFWRIFGAIKFRVGFF